MKNTFLLVSIFTLLSLVIPAQTTSPVISNPNTCATPVPDENWEKVLAKLIEDYKLQAPANKSQVQVFTIPVIVHVIHGNQGVGAYPNLPKAQIESQIQVLNEDFGGIGYNSGNYPASAFSTWAQNPQVDTNSKDFLGRIKIANCEVQFCLATKDTLGNTLAEAGIDRISYIGKGWTNPASFATINAFTNYMNGTIKPQSIWNVTKYFNIWISDANANTGLLGYATFPAFTGLSGLSSAFGTSFTDGVWCWSRAFGSASTYPNGIYSAGYNRGRTCTHEVGHWLGLRHVWGDGVCSNDYCNDTPLASSSNFGNPNYPYKTTNCTGNTPNGEMFMNFMDYTNDPIKYMFTNDQSIRIQTAMANGSYRKFLGTHNLCSVTEIAAAAQFNIPASSCAFAAITLTNTSFGTPVPTYTWSSNGGATFMPNANSPVVTVSFPVGGIYSVSLTAGNNTLSTVSKTIQIDPSPTLSVLGAQPIVCLNENVFILAGGANTYTWQPGNITGNSFSYVATNEQTISVSGTGDGNCTSSLNFTIAVTPCFVGFSDTEKEGLKFLVAPNPVTDRLTLSIHSESPTKATLTIMDVSGKVIEEHFVQADSVVSETVIDFKSYASGLYFVKITSQNGSGKTIKILKE